MTSPDPVDPAPPRGVVDWLFRDRRTGAITIAQFPNAPLWVFLVASVLSALLHPEGAWGSALAVAATAGLVVWAGWEVLAGVNPFRRLLGAGVLVWMVLGWLMHR